MQESKPEGLANWDLPTGCAAGTATRADLGPGSFSVTDPLQLVLRKKTVIPYSSPWREFHGLD